MLKRIASKLIGLYLLPFTRNTKAFYYAKNVFFTSSMEHLHQAVSYIKKRGSILGDSIIIDVGGFDGGTAMYFASQFEEAEVYCVEPNARLVPTLKEIESRHKKIFVRNLALGSSRGEADLHVTSNNVSSSLNELSVEEIGRMPLTFQAGLKEEEKLQVRVSTLDEEFEEFSDILLIKLDTQGTELDILRAGTETLKKTKFVLTEMNNHQMYKNTCQYFEVDELLRSRSFRLADIVVTYRGDNGVTEYDALYENVNL